MKLPSAQTRRALLAAAAACASTPALPRSALAVDAKNPLIAATSNLLPDESTTKVDADPVLDAIAWNAPKLTGLSTKKMAERLDAGLREREWFVTGRGLPELFSDDFFFQDPDVSVTGIEPYCRQVRRLFDQSTARCEIVLCTATGPNAITVVWRNSGKVNLGPVGFELKPYVVTTTLKTDSDSGLIAFQEDKFVVNGPELLLYQIPALRSLTSPPAPSVQELQKQYDAATGKLIV